MATEKSCGAVVFTRTQDGVRYVIIRAISGFYGLPKGHVEAGETEEQTALREVREETGLSVELLKGFRETDEYPLPAKGGATKEIVYFLGEYQGQTIRPLKSELQDAQLMRYEEAMQHFRFAGVKRVLTAARDHLKALGIEG